MVDGPCRRGALAERGDIAGADVDGYATVRLDRAAAIEHEERLVRTEGVAKRRWLDGEHSGEQHAIACGFGAQPCDTSLRLAGEDALELREGLLAELVGGAVVCGDCGHGFSLLMCLHRLLLHPQPHPAHSQVDSWFFPARPCGATSAVCDNGAVSPFIGQHDAVAALVALIGAGGAVIVRGEAGAGKTALLDEAIRVSEPPRVLRTGGVQGFGDLPYAGLAELLRPLEDHLRETASLRPLAAVIGIAPSTPAPAPMEVESALLGLMRAQAPAVWVVDDAQWLDEESARLLGRAGRQARSVGATMIATARPGGFRDYGLDELALAGLDEADARHLLAARHGMLPAEVVRWTLDVSAGNPLGLLELPRAYLLDAETARVDANIGDRILRSFGGQIAALRPASRTAIVAAALADPGDGDSLLRVLEALDVDPESLADAERLDLVHVVGGRIRFRHPLIRHAADRSATSVERRQVLGVLAAVTPFADRALRYRAGATVPPDDDLAADFAAAADAARDRAAFAAEWRHRRESARFTHEPTSRARRLIAAAGAAERAGDRDNAESLLERAIATDPTQAEDPDVVLVQFRLMTARGDAHGVRGLAERAIVRQEQVDPIVAIRGLRLALFQRMMLGQADEALELAVRALDLAGTDPAAQFLAAEAAAMAFTQVGQIADARHQAARAVALVDGGHGDSERIVTLGLVLSWLEMYADGSRLLAGEITRHRRAGNARALAGALANLADLCWRTGDLATAHATAGEAVAVAEALDDRSMLVDMLATAGHVATLRGDAEAEVLLDRAERLVVTSSSHLWIGAARAQLQVLRGDASGALSTLAGLGDLEPGAFREPNELRLAATHLQALLLAGRLHDARLRLDELAVAVERGTTRWTVAVFHRFSALLDDDPESAAAHLAMAHGALAAEDGPVERGIVELDHGRVLRRAGRRTEARQHLERAHQLFESAGSAPFAASAAGEIGAAAPRLRPRTPASGLQLTERELAVARLAAQGAPDKEIAATLFVSAKTVSFHLANSFRKLGLTSRSELSAALEKLGGVRPHD